MLKKYIVPHNLIGVGCIFIAIGIPCEGFLRGFQNTGLIALLAAAALHYFRKDKNVHFPSESILFMSMFLLVVLQFVFVNDTRVQGLKTGLKLLALLYPIAFASLPPVSHKLKRITLTVFVGCTALIALLTDVDYLLHFHAYNEMISHSKPIGIVGGTNHIYFSVIMAIAILSGLHLLKQGTSVVMTSHLDWLILVATGILFISLHLLTARTGLLAFYAALLAILFRYVWITRRYRLLIGGLTLIFLVPFSAYWVVPSVHQRINNTVEDITRYFKGDYIAYYSVSERFETWKAATHIILDHPLFGVGYGDLSQFLEAQYKIDGARLERDEFLPNCHNQYIEMFATQGILGFTVLIALLILLWKKVKTLKANNYYWLGFITIISVAFLVESMLEHQVGLTLFLFFSYFIPWGVPQSLKNTVEAPLP